MTTRPLVLAVQRMIVFDDAGAIAAGYIHPVTALHHTRPSRTGTEHARAAYLHAGSQITRGEIIIF